MKTKVREYEILVDNVWTVVETTETSERLSQHAHVAGVREVGSAKEEVEGIKVEKGEVKEKTKINRTRK